MRGKRQNSVGLALLLGALGCSAHPSAPAASAEATLEPTAAAGPGASDPSARADDAGAAGASSEDAPTDALDDSGGAEQPSAEHEALTVRPHPLDGWSEARLAAAIHDDLPSLGSMSLGSANAGGLLNGVQATETPLYKPVSPSGAWGTQETLDYLAAALTKVHAQFPETPPLALGDISSKHGGHSPPHISHQSGRDVDIAYFYNDGAGWYARGTAKNLDLPRTWAFVRALLEETDVDLILIDHSIQVLLEQYAREQGEDQAWLSGVFRGVPGQLRPIIRHAPGHATHIHIRFFNPIAQETARRCQALLVAAKLTQAPQSFVSHKVKKNETLGMISRKYGVSVERLRSVNGLKSSLIREKTVLRVPVATRGPAPVVARLRVPARRVPPPRSAPSASASASPAPGDARPGQPPPTK